MTVLFAVYSTGSTLAEFFSGELLLGLGGTMMGEGMTLSL